MDILYVLKREILNDDLRWSLRSVEKYLTGYDRIFVAGFKPRYVQGVTHVPVIQVGTKYQNVLGNIRTAVEKTDISEDFVLMNDDFIALRPIDLNKDKLNYIGGDLDAKCDEVAKQRRSPWRSGFPVARDLLRKICKHKKLYNFAVHTPYILNRKNLLEMLEIPEVKAVLDSRKTFLLRVVYGNLYRHSRVKQIKDVKLHTTDDLTPDRLEADWLSTADRMLGKGEFPQLYKFLRKELGRPCRFECN